MIKVTHASVWSYQNTSVVNTVGFWEDIAHSTVSMLLSKAGTKVDKGELKIKQIYLTKR